MKSIAIIYGSSTEHTKNAAERMAELLADYNPTLSDIYDGDEEPFLTHDVLILGVSTWGVQDLQDDWNDFYPKLEKLDLKGKTRSEEHTSELQSRPHLVCRLLLEKK